MRIEAKMVAQAVSLLGRRLAVGGAPISNRFTIWHFQTGSKTNSQSCLRRTTAPFLTLHKPLNTNIGRAKSWSVVGRGCTTSATRPPLFNSFNPFN